jgi:hypothetical protein
MTDFNMYSERDIIPLADELLQADHEITDWVNLGYLKLTLSTVHLSRFGMFLYFQRNDLIISEDVHCKSFSSVMYLQGMRSKRVTNVFRMVALDETSHDFCSQINKTSNNSTPLWSIFIFKMLFFVIPYAPIAAIFVYWMCKLISAELMDAATRRAINVTRKKKQFVVTHAIRPTEIPALLDSWFTNIPSVKMLCPQKSLLTFP